MSTGNPLLSRDLIEFQLFDWLEIDREGEVDRETVLPTMVARAAFGIFASANIPASAEVLFA